jgi:ABC-type transport system involved in multi-copper enzyme maturation permease subunit
MSSAWRSLFWKEWREQRVRLIALLAVAALLLLKPLAGGSIGPQWVSYLTVLLLAGPLVSLFLGAHAAASEQSDGTIEFLASLPVAVHRTALVKLLGALATIWIPCLAFWIAVNLIWSWLGAPTDAAGFKWVVLGYSLGCSSLLIWMAAVGVNRRDEVQAGAVGLLAILICWMLIALTSQLPSVESNWLFYIAHTSAPGGIAQIFEGPTRGYPLLLWPNAVAPVVLHLGLFAWYINRFGRVAPASRQVSERPTAITRKDWLAPPRSHAITALLWKQMRETLPLAALGAAAVLAISVVLWVSINRYDSRPSSTDLIKVAGAVWIMTGVFVSVVAGIGLFIDELRPRLHDFWKSRPIRSDQWFVVKFFPGLLMTVITVALPAALVTGVAMLVARDGGLSKSDMNQGLTIAGEALLGQAALFCLAAAMMAVTRRPVLSAVLTIIVAIGVTLAFESDSISGQAPITGLVLLCAGTVIVSTLIAWLAATTWEGAEVS